MSNEIIYWGGESFIFETRLLGVFLALFFVFAYWITLNVRISSKNKFFILGCKLFVIDIMSAQKIKWFLFFAASGILFLFILFEFHISALFVKGGEFGGGLNVDTKAIYLLVEFFLRPMLFNLGLTYILLGPRKNIYKVFFILVMIFSASPSGISRFLVASLYMPLVLVGLMQWGNKKNITLSEDFYLFPSLLLIGLFFIFPLLEVFRDFSFEKLSSFSFFEYQNGGSFDAFQMFLRALDLGSVNFGYGFLGAVLFFIPRSIWPSKPITSGIEISQLAQLRLENVSMPIIGELYLNFWYLGILFGAPVLALLLKKIDTLYLKFKCSNLSLGHLVYFQLAGLVIYNMRGGILSSFAYTISIMITWAIIYLMLRNQSTA